MIHIIIVLYKELIIYGKIVLAAIPIVWFLFIPANVDSDNEGTCYICRDNAEYQWGDYEYCEKHYYQALGKSILD